MQFGLYSKIIPFGFPWGTSYVLLRMVLIFQAVDASFFGVWLNWWMVALSLRAIPLGWDLHLACFGAHVDTMVKQYHSPGCNQIFRGTEYFQAAYQLCSFQFQVLFLTLHLISYLIVSKDPPIGARFIWRNGLRQHWHFGKLKIF